MKLQEKDVVYDISKWVSFYIRNILPNEHQNEQGLGSVSLVSHHDAFKTQFPLATCHLTRRKIKIYKIQCQFSPSNIPIYF